MRVLLAVPKDLPCSSGNRVTAGRLARRLREQGMEIGVLPVDRVADPGRWDVVHAFHLYRSAFPLVEPCRSAGVPLVVTCTGTDLSHDLHDPSRQPAMEAALRGCVRIIVFHEWARWELERRFPEAGTRLRVIPPGVELPAVQSPTDPSDDGEGAGRPLKGRGESLWLLPSGLRPVKDPLYALPVFDRLQRRHGSIRLAIAGAAIDPDLTEAVRAAARRLAWLDYLGEVPHERMAGLYRAADVVLNTSLAEGLSNAVIEAMLAGRPVLARYNPGNAAALEHGRDGLLFRDEAELERLALRLLEEPEWRARLGAAARRTAVRRYDPGKEAERHREVYEEAVRAFRGLRA